MTNDDTGPVDELDDVQLGLVSAALTVDYCATGHDYFGESTSSL